VASQQSREHADAGADAGADSWIRGRGGEVWFSEIGESSSLLQILPSRTMAPSAYIGPRRRYLAVAVALSGYLAIWLSGCSRSRLGSALTLGQTPEFKVVRRVACSLAWGCRLVDCNPCKCSDGQFSSYGRCARTGRATSACASWQRVQKAEQRRSLIPTRHLNLHLHHHHPPSNSRSSRRPEDYRGDRDIVIVDMAS
jgi:hypothetical protein